MSAVQSRYGAGPIALGEDDIGRVGNADVLVAVLGDDRVGFLQLGSVEVNRQGTGVDGPVTLYRSPKPASSSSARRAMGWPLENKPPRGRGRILPIV